MKLYKYLSDEVFRDHLESHLRGEVHLSSWREFNDPMEGFFTYTANKDPQHVVDAIVSKKSAYRVCCFCESYEEFLLWSYYTNKHRGVCLEFEVDKKGLPSSCSLKAIQYSSTLPQLDANESVDVQARRFLLTKMLPWKQEGEVRLLGYKMEHATIRFGRLTGVIFGVNHSKGDPDKRTRQRVFRIIRDLGSGAPKPYQAKIEGKSPQIKRRILDCCE